MTPLFEWKEPRAALDCEMRQEIAIVFGGFFKPKTDMAGANVVAAPLGPRVLLGNVVHFLLAIYLLALPFYAALGYLLNWPHPRALGFFTSLFILMLMLRSLGATLLKRVRTHQLLPTGVRLATGKFLRWEEIDYFRVRPASVGKPYSTLEIRPLKRRVKWYQLELQTPFLHFLHFDPDKVDAARLSALCAKYAGAEREV